jgi:hypothetical protein
MTFHNMITWGIVGYALGTAAIALYVWLTERRKK